FTSLSSLVCRLSMSPRYLALPSILFNIGVAVALCAWLLVREPPRVHRVLIGLFVLTLLVGAWRAIPYSKDFRKLHGQEIFVRAQHTQLKHILDDPKLPPLLVTC